MDAHCTLRAPGGWGSAYSFLWLWEILAFQMIGSATNSPAINLFSYKMISKLILQGVVGFYASKQNITTASPLFLYTVVLRFIIRIHRQQAEGDGVKQ